MHVLVLVAHPNPKSLTRALAAEFIRGLHAAGHTPRLLDLQADAFSPIVAPEEYAGWAQQKIPEEIQQYQELVRGAQGLALIYPVWWAAPPAILQGWLQRVFTQGFAFQYEAGRPRGLLSHKVQLIVNIGSREPSLNAYYLEPIIGVLNFAGLHNINSLINWGIHPGTPKQVITEALQAAFAAGQGF
jgi:NAD(P)H dehydrogenase (quinone)